MRDRRVMMVQGRADEEQPLILAPYLDAQMVRRGSKHPFGGDPGVGEALDLDDPKRRDRGTVVLDEEQQAGHWHHLARPAPHRIAPSPPRSPQPRQAGLSLTLDRARGQWGRASAESWSL